MAERWLLEISFIYLGSCFQCFCKKTYQLIELVQYDFNDDRNHHFYDKSMHSTIINSLEICLAFEKIYPGKPPFVVM